MCGNQLWRIFDNGEAARTGVVRQNSIYLVDWEAAYTPVVVAYFHACTGSRSQNLQVAAEGIVLDYEVANRSHPPGYQRRPTGHKRRNIIVLKTELEPLTDG